MLKEASRAALRGLMRQVGRVPITRRALHSLSVATRGCGVAFLRCRRVVPDTERGQKHPDRRAGTAMTSTELHRELEDVTRVLRFVHLSEAVEELARGRRLDQGLAVLTFDESFASTAEHALPICKQLGVPFSMFVTTGHLFEPTTLWDEAVRGVVEALAPNPIRVSWIDRVLRTETAKRRAAATRRLLLSLASLDEDRLHKRLDELFARTGGRPAVDSVDRMITADELRLLAKDPLVTIGAHGHRHVSLANASDDALLHELAHPRAVLRELCGESFVNVVSYPFGRPPYVDDRAVDAARAAGYRAGFTAEPGVARPGDHQFRLPRLPIGPWTSGVVAYELQGTIEAVDEIVMVASGERAKIDRSLQG